MFFLDRRILLLCTVFVSISAQTQNLPDFTDLINSTTPAVVKINTLSSTRVGSAADPSIPPFLENSLSRTLSLFGQRQRWVLALSFLRMAMSLPIITLLAGVDKIVVRLNDRREYDAVVVGSDSRSDLALLKIEESNLPILEFADSESLDVGDWVVAIGSPFDLDYSASAGIVSAIGRSLPNGTGQDYVPFIQTDVAINPGNSGGPLFNLKGEVVGINSQIFTRSGGFMGLSFAVPVAVANDVLAQLKQRGEVTRGWLGVVIQDIDRALADSLGLDVPRGALVARVLRSSPADEAGLRAGDVILEFDGEAIDYSHDLPHVVGLVEPGARVNALVLRERRETTIRVEVGELNQGGQTGLASKSVKQPAKRALGLSVDDVEATVLAQLEIDGGVMITNVQASSAAAKAGLLADDVIAQIAFKDIMSVISFEEVLSSLSAGSIVPILFYRNGTAVFRTIQVDG